MLFGPTVTCTPALEENGRYSWLCSMAVRETDRGQNCHAHVYADGTVVYHGPPPPPELEAVAGALAEWVERDRLEYGGENEGKMRSRIGSGALPCAVFENDPYTQDAAVNNATMAAFGVHRFGPLK